MQYIAFGKKKKRLKQRFSYVLIRIEPLFHLCKSRISEYYNLNFQMFTIATCSSVTY